jgi:hypothetical protein
MLGTSTEQGGQHSMNVKQTLILLGAAAIAGTLVYLTVTGQGVHQEEVWKLAATAAALVGATGGLIWAFRD